MTTKISPVLRGNLLNISEKIKPLHPSAPHARMLQNQIQLAYFQVKEQKLPEAELLLSLFNQISGSFDAGVFETVQKEALALINGIVGKEMVRPT